MARSLWTGSISFGLVNVPIQLFAALQDRDVRFHQLHDADGVRIKTVRVCPDDGEEVPYDEVVRGYEVAKGEYVTITDEELDALAPERTRTIDIEEFVDLEEIDPIRFDHAYYVLPQGESAGTQRAYRLLQQVMADSGKVAIGRFVLRAKEYLAALRAVDGVMLIHTMLFDDEVKPREEYVELIGDSDEKVDETQLRTMRQLVDELSRDFEPDRYENRQRDRILSLVERKAEGEGTVSQPEPEEPEPVPDLMAALEATLKDVRSRGGDGSSEGGDSKPRKKKATAGSES